MHYNSWARVPQLLKLLCPRARASQREATTMRSQHTATRKQSLLTTTSEKSMHSNKAQCNQKQKLFLKIKKKKNLPKSKNGQKI